jgi:hypothetical protein
MKAVAFFAACHPTGLLSLAMLTLAWLMQAGRCAIQRE